MLKKQFLLLLFIGISYSSAIAQHEYDFGQFFEKSDQGVPFIQNSTVNVNVKTRYNGIQSIKVTRGNINPIAESPVDAIYVRVMDIPSHLTLIPPGVHPRMIVTGGAFEEDLVDYDLFAQVFVDFNGTQLDGTNLFEGSASIDIFTPYPFVKYYPEDAASVFWGMQVYRDFLGSKFNFYDWGGLGSHGLRACLKTTSPSAYYNLFKKMVFSVKSPLNKTNFKSQVSLDVVAHETTHALLHASKNIICIDQLANSENHAIQEAFCDIMGVSLRREIEQSDIWTYGDLYAPGNPGEMRNFANPHSLGHPDTYQEPIYWRDYNDPLNYDPHANGEVVNKFFYFLVKGGAGTNGINNSYVVVPLSDTPGQAYNGALQLVFKTMTKYFTQSTNLNEFRDQTLVAAVNDLGWQPGSPQFITIVNAWHAVGVGDKFNPEPFDNIFQCTNANALSMFNLQVNIDDGLVTYQMPPHSFPVRKLESCGTLIRPVIYTVGIDEHNEDFPFSDADLNGVYDMYNNMPKSKAGVSVHWSTQQAFNYFAQQHSYFGVDGIAETTIVSKVSFTGNIITDGFDPLNNIFRYDGANNGNDLPRISLDIVSKEIAEAIFYEHYGDVSNLTEASIIRESFGYIFGRAVNNNDLATKNYQLKWNFAEINNTYETSFSDPKINNRNQPTFHNGEFFNTALDPSFNASVLNFFYYLLAHGGSGYRDFNPNNPINPGKGSYVVVPISREKAEEIIFKTIIGGGLTLQLNFVEFANEALKITETYFGGTNSQEYVSVTNALYAVGLLDQPYGGFPGSLPKDQAGILDPKDAVEPWDLKAWQTQSYVAETKNPVYQFAFAYDPAEINKCNTILGSLNCGNAEVFTSPETAMSINGLSIMVNATLHANKIVYWKLFITEYDGLDCRSSLDVCDNIILPINSTTPIQSFKTDTRKPEVLAGQQVYPWFGDQSIEVAAVRGAQQYQVLATVDTNPEFKFPLLINEIINSTSADPEKLKTQGCLHVETKYLAKAMAVGPYEDVTHELTNGVWSEPAEFITTSPSVKIIEPSYGAKVAPFGVPIKLEWEEAPGAAFYKLMISDNANDPNQNNVTWEHIGDIYDTEYFLNDGNGYQLKNIADGKQYGFTVTPYSPICMPEVTTHEKGLTTKGSFVLEKQLIPLVTPLSPSGCQNYEDKLVFTWQPIVGGNEITYKISVVNDLKTIGSATIKGAANSSVEIPGLPSTPDNTVTGDILWTIHAESNGVQGPSTGLVYKFKSAQITGLNLYKNGNVSQPDPNQIDAWQDLGAEWNSKWSPFGYHVTVWRTDANTITWEDDFSTEFCTIPSGALRVDVLHKLTVISKNPYCGITAEQDLFFKTKAKKEEAEPKPDPKPTDDPENCDVTFYVEWWDFIYQDGNPNTSVPGENYDGKVEAGLEYTTDGINFFPMTDANQLPNQVPFLLSGVSGAATQVTFFPASIGTVKIYVKVYKREGQFSVLNEPTVEITPTPGAPSSIGLFGILPGQHHVVAELNCPSTTDGRVANQTIAGQSLKAISNVAEDELTIAPNPVESTITISGAIDEFSEMTIQNVTGQIVYHGKPIAKLDVKHLSPGVYILKIGTRVIRFVKK